MILLFFYLVSTEFYLILHMLRFRIYHKVSEKHVVVSWLKDLQINWNIVGWLILLKAQYYVLCRFELYFTEKQADEEIKRLKDLLTCKICVDNDAWVVFLPCGHIVSYDTCAQALRKCPICRVRIAGQVKSLVK